MFPGLTPKKMQAMMKQLGISQQEIPAKRVVIETSDTNIIINNPSVIKINMQGQTNFQISGDVSEESSEGESDAKDTTKEDIRTIMEKVGCLEEEARIAYEKSNKDLTEAILMLS